MQSDSKKSCSCSSKFFGVVLTRAYTFYFFSFVSFFFLPSPFDDVTKALEGDSSTNKGFLLFSGAFCFVFSFFSLFPVLEPNGGYFFSF